MGTVGFVGLGNMGSVLASNLVQTGHAVAAHDVLGPERVPEGATYASDVAELARCAEVVVLSLPDGAASRQVAGEMLAVADRRTTHVVDTSTIGVCSAQRLDAMCTANGVAYVDAPVSGGVAGARARTLAVMYAGSDDACARVEPVLAGLSDLRHRVGDRPGLGQAMKLANNFLSATALVATSEAVAFGVPQPCADRSLRIRLHELPDGQGHGPLPARGRGRRQCRVDRRGDRLGVGAFRRRRTGRRLHPHLSLRRRFVMAQEESP